MEYKRFDKKVVVRLDKGEELVAKLKSVARKENIKCASITAIGAVENFSVSVFDVDKKAYRSNDFIGKFEIVSLLGTVSEMDGEPYLHLHMSAGREDGSVFGGHLTRARISPTCEVVIQIIDGTVNRVFDESTGLNTIKF